MAVVQNYPLLEVFWTMLIFFAFVVWIWLLFVVFGDIFRRKDSSGWAKVLWIIFIVLLPYLGVFVYLIAQHSGMQERAIARAEEANEQMASYVRNVASDSSPAEQIAKAQELKQSGAISDAEFEQLKQKALAS
jgi:hypothetical protein